MTSRWTWGECKTFSGLLSNDFWTICYLVNSIVTWTFKSFLFHCNNLVSFLFNFLCKLPSQLGIHYLKVPINLTLCIVVCRVQTSSWLSSVHWLQQQSRSRTAWQQSVNSNINLQAATTTIIIIIMTRSSLHFCLLIRIILCACKVQPTAMK